jgi:hypothetical protein
VLRVTLCLLFVTTMVSTAPRYTVSVIPQKMCKFSSMDLTTGSVMMLRSGACCSSQGLVLYQSSETFNVHASSVQECRLWKDVQHIGRACCQVRSALATHPAHVSTLFTWGGLQVAGAPAGRPPPVQLSKLFELLLYGRAVMQEKQGRGTWVQSSSAACMAQPCLVA